VLGAEAKTEWDIGPHRYASVDVKFESGVNYTWADWGGPTCPPRLFLLRPHKNAKFPYFTKSLDSFDQYCAAYVKDWLTRFNATIGLSAIVVLGDQVVFSKGYGHTTMDPASPPPTEDSIFRIGSITKYVREFVEYRAGDMRRTSNLICAIVVQDLYESDADASCRALGCQSRRPCHQVLQQQQSTSLLAAESLLF